MTLHHPEHGPPCMCTDCQDRAHDRVLRERASKALPERDVHWPWLHGDTPPGAALSPREAFERTHAHLMPRRAS
jgi:hypothetical protein